MTRRYSVAVLVGTLVLFAAPKAEAATFELSYTAHLVNGVPAFGTLTALIHGTLQADNFTVFVDSVSDAKFDGVAGPAITYVTSMTNRVAGPSSIPATLTLSHGTTLDFLACNDIFCGVHFAFDDVVQSRGGPAYLSLGGYGNTSELYDPNFYFLTPVADATPLPAALPLFASGAGILGFLGWRRKKKAAARAE